MRSFGYVSGVRKQNQMILL